MVTKVQKRPLSIKAKELLIVSLAMAAPFILFFYVVNLLVVNTNRETSFRNIRSADEILISTIDEQADSIYRYSVILLRDPNVRYLVQDIQREFQLGSYINQKSEAVTLTDTLSSSEYVNDIQFYVNGKYSGLFDNKYFFNISDIASSDAFPLLQNSPPKGLWIIEREENSPSMFYLVKVVHPDNYHEFGSVIRINYSVNYLNRIFHTSLPDKCSSFLMTGEGELLLSAGPDLLNHENSSLTSISPGQFVRQKIDGRNYWIYKLDAENLDLSLITAIPANSFGFFATYDTSLFRTLLAVFICWIIIFFLALRNITHMTSRIQTITSYVNKRRETSEAITIPQFNEQDELTDLADHFNLLSKELAENMDKVYQLGVEKRSSDLRALQAQINPHFLYNTLDMIDFYAYDEKPEVVEEIVSKLAQFYKLSLNNGRELYTLMEELNLIHAYFDIQKIRFRDSITLVEEVPEQYLQCQIPPITLQPLVENSILHGIREKDNKSGEIRITAEEKENVLILHVLDDGVGIPASVVEQLNSELADPIRIDVSAGASHYGIHNINQRIKIMFGQAYGIVIINRDNGSEVNILLPL